MGKSMGYLVGFDKCSTERDIVATNPDSLAVAEARRNEGQQLEKGLRDFNYFFAKYDGAHKFHSYLLRSPHHPQKSTSFQRVELEFISS